MPKCKQSKKYKILPSICIIIIFHGSLTKLFFFKEAIFFTVTH